MIRKKFRATYLLVLFLGLIPNLAQAIDPPANPRGTEVGQSLVKWEWNRVPGAVNYRVTVDGKYKGLTQDPQYFSRNLWAGDHSLTVRTVGADGSYSASTPTVKIKVSARFSSSATNRGHIVEQDQSSSQSLNQSNNVAAPPPSASASGSLGTPANPRGTESSPKTVTWGWDAVAGAANYEVTVDGAYAGKTSSTQFTSNNLWIGEHSMTVKAIDSNGTYSPQSATVKVNVTGSGNVSGQNTNTNTAVSAPAPPQGNPDAANVQSMIDPASYNYPEVNQKPGFELTFSDEFNGTALNSYRWHSNLRWDGEFNGERYEYRVINGEDQFYVSVLSSDEAHRNQIVPKYNPFQFDGSRLAIRAAKNPLKTNNNKQTYGSLSEISSQQTFLSGAISSHEKFNQKHGYFEARIKIPKHEGTFPAFWLFHENRAWEGTQRTEIDVMENLGHAPWYIYNSFHYFKNVRPGYGGDANFLKPSPSGQIYTGIDYSQDYHVYAVDWQPGKIVWYIDDQQVSELYSNEVSYENLYVMLNLAMGGNWTNFPANAGGLGRPDNERFPNQNDLNNFGNPALEIDYVRIYRRK